MTGQQISDFDRRIASLENDLLTVGQTPSVVNSVTNLFQSLFTPPASVGFVRIATPSVLVTKTTTTSWITSANLNSVGVPSTASAVLIQAICGTGTDNINVQVRKDASQTGNHLLYTTGVSGIRTGIIVQDTGGVNTIDYIVSTLTGAGKTVSLYVLGYYNNIGSISSGGGGTGSVTSVALSLPAEFTVTGSPVVSSGTLTGTWASEAINVVFAGPASGSSGTPGFRALVSADIPQSTYDDFSNTFLMMGA